MTDNFPIRRGDLKPEMFIFGQIVGGKDFEIDEGISCEVIVQVGDQWELFTNRTNFQTQTSYPEPGELTVWNHPLDLNFSCKAAFGWPKMIFRIWRLDETNRMDILSYGQTHVPNTSGFHHLEVPTWSLKGKFADEALFHFIGPPKLIGSDPVKFDLSNVQNLETKSSGTIVLELEILFKNFQNLFISGQLKTREEREFERRGIPDLRDERTDR
mmetsp:Transcript_39312/g.44750  ORF Transcript_39312/g.44750 Transcript_39312/m.44750 type:complete len:214 (+) Transcript_39312:154-795(+)|eukprot:CAMPEP_0114986616 /NCGR_PEP_ID=MMETSP0216-20121206/8526_1 /TAXON_ID=223996 /ORGANISM="Protocruzia adherens, Strain Boccale" /LENGTH=213 /DNA_ID=CAMNT_0002349073 /DNA_START=137 /DNA_END=778 /DNA_ORIENTATION=-